MNSSDVLGRIRPAMSIDTRRNMYEERRGHYCKEVITYR